MSQGKQLYEWYYWASLEAILVNINRDPKKGRMAKIEDFHPMLPRKAEANRNLGDYLLAQKELARRRRLKLDRKCSRSS